ncbi:DUF2231 domain-containing protein [Paenibacillus thalictri]|uniref:DUF2231 domain-containing protein n=1 Tax=Paenibacillus thalictri TaxID=2527873 RepID=A0A4Q9DTR1_9BACL|nr:DUF2231 domain-containing protein [Paenibacillus thalictri]TBL79726.1 hypothetical protein EYB31_08935 [Paenibacillus thalictri]
MSYLFKNAHFIVIHIPIAMLVFSFLFDVAAKLARRKEWHTAGLLCLIVGALGAVAAVVTGPEDRNPLVHTHELYGKLTMIAAVLMCVVRLYFAIKRKRELGGYMPYLAAALVSVLLVSYTGHIGGEMVHPDRGMMPQGQLRDGGPRPEGAPGQSQRPGTTPNGGSGSTGQAGGGTQEGKK